jgi:5-methylcytosine-specific restriction protein A
MALWSVIRQMTRDEVQQQVRQRDRFQCQGCGRTGEQYAHVVPESEGGEYKLENIVLLCYRCHHTFQETLKTTGEMRQALLALGLEMRDAQKLDGSIDVITSWARGPQLSASLGGGVTFIDQERILECETSWDDPYLTISTGDRLHDLQVCARFEDASGNTFMRIDRDRAVMETAAAWDIVFSRRSMEYIHADRNVWLKIAQGSDSTTLRVTGNLYMNGGLFEISDSEIYDQSHNNHISANAAYRWGHGQLLKPGSFIL